jgi:hypothetical protein
MNEKREGTERKGNQIKKKKIREKIPAPLKKKKEHLFHFDHMRWHGRYFSTEEVIKS